MHVHYGLSKDGGKFTSRSIHHLLDEGIISHAVVFPIDEQDVGPSYAKLNYNVAELAQKNKRIIGFCRLNPHEMDTAVVELKKAVDRGLRGVKLHPKSENFSVHEVEDLIAEIEKHKLPIVLHTAHESHCHPKAWRGIFKRHKKIYFIMAHAGKDAYKEAAEIAKECPNVFLDTSTLSTGRTRVLLEKVGPGKLVFASDAPYSYPQIEYLKFEILLGNKEAAKKKIFEENPRRILGGLPR